MSEFGTPQRSATSDANAGVVNPPAKQHVARDTVGTSNRQLSGAGQAAEALGTGVGSQLGNALAAMVADTTATTNAQRAIDASARQGIESAVNEVDKVKQRTGWEKAIFGENIEYRAAQQRAVENKVQATYLEDLSNIDSFAGDTPAQYHERQKIRNEIILKEYADDPDTRTKVQGALAASGQKLAKAQYKSHYAYNQLQQQETERTRIQQTFDGFTLESPTLMTPESKQGQIQDIKKFFSGSSKPSGMTNLAHRALMIDVIQTNMKAGNAGPMLAAQAMGMDKSFSAGEQVQWDQAIGKYDSHYSQTVDLIRTNADIQIAAAVTPAQIDAAVQTKAADLKEIATRASGSQKSKLILARGNLDVAKDEKSLRDSLEKENKKLQADADKKKLELETKAMKDATVAKYFSTNDPATKAAIQSDNALTKKEKEQGFDTHLVVGAQKFVGGETPPTVQEFGRALQQDPKLQTWVLQEMKRTGETSPMIKTILTTATQSTDRLFDEDGNASEIGHQTVNMVSKLLEADKGVDLIGGKDAHRQWRIVAQGVQAGSGQANIEKKQTMYNANKGKADAAGFQWKSLIGDSSRRDWMKSKLRKLGIPNPSDQMITDELYNYREDVTAFGSDTKEADNSMFQRVQNNKTKVFNSNLANAKEVEEATKWTTQDFITNAEKHNFMTGKYGDLLGNAATDVRSHTQIPNLRWYTKPGVSGLFASSPSSNNEMFISVEEMQDIEESITQRETIDKNIAESRGNAAIKAWEAEREILRIAQPLMGY